MANQSIPVSKRVFFPSGNLKLEGVLETPSQIGAWPAVVVCHPHPLYGGDMDNNMVTVITESLVLLSIAALRFNFRGTGYSEGSFSDGIGEQEDIRAAIDYLSSLKEIDSTSIGLAGYSFGARVALSCTLSDDRVRAIATVSPQIPQPVADKLKNYARPKLFISGANDEFMPAGQIEELVKTFSEPKIIKIVNEADHFWRRHDREVAEMVGAFFKEVFK